jgi:transposase
LGYRFGPRIKGLKDRKLYSIEKPSSYPALEPLIGGVIDTAAIIHQATELRRLSASIKTGMVAPSVILRKLSAAGASNPLSHALQAVGRIERTLFTLNWLSDPALRQRSHAGLNKGEASNSLRRALFFQRQGEFRDRTFENQSFQASGLTLVTAAIVHWNTVYLDRAVQHVRTRGVAVSDIVAPAVFDKPMDGPSFLAYVEQAVAPCLRPGDVVLMDNLPAHKVAGVENAIRSAGASLLFTPPYSPDFNPIEKFFSKLKSILRRLGVRTKEALDDAIADVCATLTNEECRNFFISCGYGVD